MKSEQKTALFFIMLFFAFMTIQSCDMLNRKSNPVRPKDDNTLEGFLPGSPPAEYPNAPPITSAEEEIKGLMQDGHQALADVCGIPSWTILQQANIWLGVTYYYGGNSRSGIDCSHLVYQVYGGACIKYPYFSVAQMKASSRFICVNPVGGDVITFVKLDHCGIYVGNGWMIDANSYYGKVRYDNIWDPYWSVLGPYAIRFKG